MKGRRTVLMTVSVALIALLLPAMLMWLPFSQTGEPSITLPPPLPGGLWPNLAADATPPGAVFVPADLEQPENIRRLLLSLASPTAFSQTVQTTYYWEDGSRGQTHRVYERDGLMLVETAEEDGIRMRLFTPEGLYRWTKGNPWYYQSPLPVLFPGELTGIPHLSTLLALPRESIIGAEYLGDFKLCVYTQEPYYNGLYTVSLSEKLLLEASYTDGDGLLVYRCVSLTRSFEKPDASLFTLPDGTSPQ